jgi:hypothetical protein
MRLMPAIIAMMLLSTSPVSAFAADMAAGKVTHAKGDVSLFQTGRSAPTPLRDGDQIFAGDEIETGNGASVTIDFADKATLSMGAQGNLKVSQYQFSGSAPKTVRLNATKAPIEWNGGDKETADTEITTDYGTIAVDKAHLVQGRANGGYVVYVQGGSAVVKNSGGKVEVPAGQGATVNAPGAKPEGPAAMTAEQVAPVRTALPAPKTPWDVAGGAAPATDPAAPAADAGTGAPMEVPPVSTDPAAATPAPTAEAIPTPPPADAAPVAVAPEAAPAPATPEVPAPVAVPEMPAAQAPVAAPVPAIAEPVVPGQNPQAAVVTPAPAPTPSVTSPQPEPVPAPLPELPPMPQPVQ